MNRGEKTWQFFMRLARVICVPAAFVCLQISVFAAEPEASNGSSRTGSGAALEMRQGIYEIQSAAGDGFVVDVRHCAEQSVDYGTLQLYRPLQVKQQEFYLEQISAHGFRLVSLESGKYLTEANVTGTWEGAAPEEAAGEVRMEARVPSDGTGRPDSQFFSFISRPDGSFLITSSQGLYLTLEGDRACNGASLTLAPFTGLRNQKWYFTAAPVYGENTAETDAINPYLEDGPLDDVSIRIRFKDVEETLTSQTLASWIDQADPHATSISEDQLHAYVTHLAERFNTIGHSRTFITSYKVPITLYSGNYGWKLDEWGTFEMLKKAIAQNGSRTLFPKWVQEGGDFYGTNSDIGDSYIEIDLNAQKLWLYKDGEKLLETDFVSGTKNTDRETPGGVYYIYYKQSPAVLRGADYESPVNFWMPYNGNIGLHDAPWRSEFGGQIYQTDGSHGCINLPYDAAKKIYETVDIGYPVVSYK